MMRAPRLPIVMDVVPAFCRAEKGEAMHAQVVTFELNGITDEQFHGAAEADAPTFANLPGLLAKTWLRDPETNTYGGLYIWADQEAYEATSKARSSTRSRPTST